MLLCCTLWQGAGQDRQGDQSLDVFHFINPKLLFKTGQ